MFSLSTLRQMPSLVIVTSATVAFITGCTNPVGDTTDTGEAPGPLVISNAPDGALDIAAPPGEFNAFTIFAL